MRSQRRFFLLLATCVALLSSTSAASAGLIFGAVSFKATATPTNNSSANLENRIHNLSVVETVSGSFDWSSIGSISVPNFQVGDKASTPTTAFSFGNNDFGTFTSTGSFSDFSSNSPNPSQLNGTRTVIWNGTFKGGSNAFFVVKGAVGLNHNATVTIEFRKTANGSAGGSEVKTFTLSTVPEPTSLGLVTTALVGGLSFLRRRKSV